MSHSRSATRKLAPKAAPEGLSDQELTGMLEAMVAHPCYSIRRYEASGQLEMADREMREIEVIALLPASWMSRRAPRRCAR